MKVLKGGRTMLSLFFLFKNKKETPKKYEGLGEEGVSHLFIYELTESYIEELNLKFKQEGFINKDILKFEDIFINKSFLFKF